MNPQRRHLNHGRYHGETITVEEVLRDALGVARHHGWTLGHLPAAPGLELPVLLRPPREVSAWAPRIYVSAGIHGDEPAGPLAALRLLEENAWPPTAALWMCPCLNPTGFARNTRENAAGQDLNRDYRHLRTDEVRAHVTWLREQPLFDLCLCLHEDWEASGFYVYEQNPDRRPSLAGAIIEAVAEVCPIDPSPMIDGREAVRGIIRPNLDPASRPEWAEAFYLLQNKTRLSYTLEAPSDFPLTLRVDALTVAVKRAVMEIVATPVGG